MYHKAALGGTFDRLHLGHQHLLKTAINSANSLIIGLTTQKLIQTKNLVSLIQPYSERKSELTHYLKSITSKPFQIVPLDDVFGPTLTDSTIDVLVVTPQTLTGSERINQKRQQLGLLPLPVIQANLILDQKKLPISSTKIREGYINRQGEYYRSVFTRDVVINDRVRNIIQKPQGEVIVSLDGLKQILDSPHSLVSLVGDYVTHYFIENNLFFNYAIVDGITQQSPNPFTLKAPDTYQEFSATNPKGQISENASKTIYQLMREPSAWLNIQGEEDLLAFPLISVLPLNSLVFYGQKSVGLVMIKITESTKSYFYRLLRSKS